MFVTPAYAQAAGEAGGSSSFLTSMFPLILIFVIFYFLLIRPQQKRAKEHKLTVANLRRGDQVVTAGGVIAKVTKVIDDDEVEVEIATVKFSKAEVGKDTKKYVKVKLVRSTITVVLSKTEPANDS